MASSNAQTQAWTEEERQEGQEGQKRKEEEEVSVVIDKRNKIKHRLWRIKRNDLIFNSFFSILFIRK